MKRESPSASRNTAPIVEALVPHLAAVVGDLLEIGSGTGQHAIALATALPELIWWPTDTDGAQLASIKAWREEAGLANVRPPVALDAAAETWGLGSPGFPPSRLAGIFSANVLHITPQVVTRGLFAGAARHLLPGGLLILYGPFRWSGQHNAESNAAFHADLQQRDPSWGLRDVDDLDALGTAAALERRSTIEMPANNHILIYERKGRNADAP